MTDSHEKEAFFSTEVEVPRLSERPKVPLSEMDQAGIKNLIALLKISYEAFNLKSRTASNTKMAKQDLQKLGVYLKLRFKLAGPVYGDEATGTMELICPITGVPLPDRPADQHRQKTFFSAPQPALLKASEPTNPRGIVEQAREKAGRVTPPPPPPPADAQQTGDEEIIEIEDDWIVDDDVVVEMDSDPESSQKLQQVLQERMPATDFEAAKTVVKGLQEAGGPQLGEMLGQDELPEEFRGSAINNTLDREMQDRELKVKGLKWIYEGLIEGGGMEFEDRFFDKVDEEDEWGLRKVEFLGKFNYLGRDNRLIYPKEIDKWFVTVPKDGFRERKLWKKFGSEKEIVVTLVTVDGIHKFISREGQLLDTSHETMEAYYRDPSDEIWSDIHITEYATVSEAPAQIRFLEDFSKKLIDYAERYNKDDQQTFQAFNRLAQNVQDFKEGKPDWETALLEVESLTHESDLGTGDKVHYYRVLLDEAGLAKLKVNFKFATSISSRRWVDIDRYHNGTVVRLHNGEVKYNLMNDQGQLVYSEDEAFDYIDQFVRDIARVKRNGKWHFISRIDGRLLEEDESEWFAEIYKAKNGMFRIKGEDGRYRFATTSGELINPVTGFVKASDFSSDGKATVIFVKDEFQIDRQGDRVTLLSQRVSDFVSKLLRSFTATPTVRPKDRLIGGETPLDLPPKDRKPYETGDSSERISSLFSELLKGSGSLKETRELMKLFQRFREVFQEENEKKSKSKFILLHLRGRVQKSELSTSVKEGLERFLKKLKYGTKMKWVQQPPLSVNFLDYFKGYLTENSDSDALIVLLIKLESWFICTRMGEISSGSLLKNLKQVINQSSLDSKAKTRLKTAVMLMLVDPDIQNGMSFEQGFSMNRYHKLLQSRRARQRQITSGVPVPITPLQKKANEQALNQELDSLCRMLQIEAEGAKKGKLKGVAVDTFQQFHNLVQKNPQHRFDHLKFGIALENLAHAIEKYIELEDVPGSDKSILRIKKHEAIKLTIAIFEGALKLANSPDAEASIQRHLGICKSAMNMNKEARDHMKASLAISEDPVLREEFDTLRLSVRSRLRKAWIVRIAGLAVAGYAALWFYENTEPYRVRTRVQECLVAAQPCADLAEVTDRFRVLKRDRQEDQILLLKAELKTGNNKGMSQAFTELYNKNKQYLPLQLEMFNLFKEAEKLENLQQTMNSLNDPELETEEDVKVKSFMEILLELERAKGIEKKRDWKKALKKVVQDGESLMHKRGAQKAKFAVELYELMGSAHELLGNVKKAKGYKEIVTDHHKRRAKEIAVKKRSPKRPKGKTTK